MGRPQIDDETLDRLEEIVDARTKVPASHLTTSQRLSFVLDELEDADSRIDYLADRVDSLEAEVEEARAEADRADQATGGVGGGFNLGGGGNRRQF